MERVVKNLHIYRLLAYFVSFTEILNPFFFLINFLPASGTKIMLPSWLIYVMCIGYVYYIA